MRGEKRSNRLDIRSIVGSSPHARGKVFVCYKSNVIFRIIPACAGKSSPNRPEAWKSQDHPRMRGEKSALSRGSRNITGSSPHARGKGVCKVLTC